MNRVSFTLTRPGGVAIACVRTNYNVCQGKCGSILQVIIQYNLPLCDLEHPNRAK